MERLQQRINNFVVFLASTLATLGNSSTCNITAAAVSPSSLIPQISPIQSPHLSSPSPVDVSVNNTTASNSTHVPSVPETQSNTTTPSPPPQKKMPRLPPDYLSSTSASARTPLFTPWNWSITLTPTTTLRTDGRKPSSPPLLETDVFGPLALYKTNHGTSLETSSIDTTAFQTLRPQ